MAGTVNAELVRPSEAGTLTAALDVPSAVRPSGYRIVLSARSGDTQDTWLTRGTATHFVGWPPVSCALLYLSNSATGLDLARYAAGRYSLISPPRSCRRRIW